VSEETPPRGRAGTMWGFTSVNRSIGPAAVGPPHTNRPRPGAFGRCGTPSGVFGWWQRQGGKGRSDAVRLLTRGTLRRVTASRGRLRSRKRDEPHGRRQGATNLPALVRSKPSRW
jgi:hypothetical protein